MTPDHRPSQHPRAPIIGVRGFRNLGPVHMYVRVVAVALLILVTGLAGGMVLERYVVSGAGGTGATFPYLEEVVKVVDQNYYYRPTSPDDANALDEKMEQHAIIGALASLDDPYTRYLSSDQSSTAQEDLEGRYGGTGIDVAISSDRLVVTSVVPDSPADDAGILRGDVIEQIDNAPVDTGDFEGLIRDLRGEVGTTVALAMARPSTDSSFEVTLTREEIVVPPVTLRMIDGTAIGWLRITIFGDETTAQVDAAIRTLQHNGATGIVLDLRGNGGGWVTSAQGVLGRFLEPGAGPALYEDTTPGDGGAEPLPIVNKDGSRTDLPLVVLIDSGTASAAEIVAGALQDYDRALIVGEPSYGKGSVQRIFSFDDGASLRVTVAEWFTPDRDRIQHEGIQPEIVISPDDDTAPDADPALDRAVELLQSGITPTASPEASPASSPASAG